MGMVVRVEDLVRLPTRKQTRITVCGAPIDAPWNFFRTEEDALQYFSGMSCVPGKYRYGLTTSTVESWELPAAGNETHSDK